MAKKRLTPEEQLLDLIEKGGDVKAVKFKQKRNFLRGFGNIRQQALSFGREIAINIGKLKIYLREPNLKSLNKIFFASCIIVVSYAANDFIFKRPDINKIYKRAQTIKYKELEENPEAAQLPFLYYLEMVQRRNIFSPITLKETEKPEIKEAELQDLAKDLKLVGISWGPQPQVMIEDQITKKTYFLGTGDTINKFKIETILKDRIILSYEGKKIELM